MQIELIADYQCETGEGPLWHPDEKRVYWTDIPQGRMFRYDPAGGRHEQFYGGPPVGGATVQADGALLLFMACGAVAVWRDGRLTTVIEQIPDEVNSRFNDVIADPAGRVFCGTMSGPDHKGRLYRLDPDGSLTVVLENVGTSNGMGFTPDRRHFYHIDTPTREICIFDYDAARGAISNRRVFVRTPDGFGGPDGMTVDAEGFVWAAKWGGGRLERYTPDARLERTIELPARKVSSLTFGGEDYDDIYVTTAGGPTKDEDGPGAGALFRVRCAIRGVPEFRSRIGL
jgi:D-xylonolactonase